MTHELKPVGLTPDRLRRRCDPSKFEHDTTAEMDKLTGLIGQPRAEAALAFAVGIEHEGYHLFAVGPEGVGRRFALLGFLRDHASKRSQPPDWCYVHNFDEPHEPRALKLPAGKGAALKEDMSRLVDDLKTALTASFSSEEYQTRRQLIDEQFNEKPQKALHELHEHADQRDFAVLRTPVGIIFAPMRNGKVLPKEEYLELPDDKRKDLDEQTKELEREFKRLVEKIPEWEGERKEQVKKLNAEVTTVAVTRLMSHLRGAYEQLPEVDAYLDSVEKDVVAHASDFIESKEQSPLAELQAAMPDTLSESSSLGRYEVNVIVDHRETDGAPVVLEENPSYQNLVGRVEHLSRLGTLTTDFRLIRPGALHRANGGYLLLDARKLLTQPYAWEGLKLALSSREVRIESLGQALSLISTISLEPQPVPLDLKIVLYGNPRLYYLLSALDPEFSNLFKVGADFAGDMDRTDESEVELARLIATICEREQLRPFDRKAVARIVEECSRRVGDAGKLSVHMAGLVDLLREANYFSKLDDSDLVGSAHVDRAVEGRVFRSDRLRERMHEQIARNTVLIDTAGEKVGQVNGLSALQVGEFRFGMPTRITARVRLGKGEVVDIEREVELGGPLHSKGVLILAGFLGERYAANRPLALSASLVFEQSYGGVEGDSATVGELAALLSAIAEVPVRQSLAITGSMNQLGQVQPIGAVNEKIEGFFDVCRQRGLTGDQGVIIPEANIKHLMLRPEVIAAVAEGRFHVYPVDSVDDALCFLFGLPAGLRDGEGNYPKGSLNRLVSDRLGDLADRLVELNKPAQESRP